MDITLFPYTLSIRLLNSYSQLIFARFVPVFYPVRREDKRRHLPPNTLTHTHSRMFSTHTHTRTRARASMHLGMSECLFSICFPFHLQVIWYLLFHRSQQRINMLRNYEIINVLETSASAQLLLSYFIWTALLLFIKKNIYIIIVQTVVYASFNCMYICQHNKTLETCWCIFLGIEEEIERLHFYTFATQKVQIRSFNLT